MPCRALRVARSRVRNEIKAVSALLAMRDVTDTVITMDALLTQRKLARQIQRQHGHYLMIVKRNQALLYDVLERWFAIPTIPADNAHADQVRTVNKGHGRLEMRTLECSPAWNGISRGPACGKSSGGRVSGRCSRPAKPVAK
jgi:predicted transposase YbfD/YdcC